MLDIRNIGKIYTKKGETVRALDDVSLTVSAGEFVAVQGPSGCGKTTLLLIAGGLLTPDEGTILVDGQAPYELSSEQRALFRATRVGFVFQQFHLIPYLTIWENILTPIIATPIQNAETRAEKLLKSLNLSERRNHIPSELSTGERQRVALGRALLGDPKVLLADEPTGNLDEENGEIVLRFLKEFSSGGGAVLMVTHDRKASQCADRIVRMKAGRLVDQ